MGVEYYVYAEAKAKGVWHAIGGSYRRIGEEGFATAPVLVGCRSAFSESWDKLLAISDGHVERPEELSESLGKELEFLFRDGSGYVQSPITADLEEIKRLAPEGEFSRHGFVHKDIAKAYRDGDAEYLFPAELEEGGDGFYALTPEERAKVYEYREWDDYCSWQYWFKEMAKTAEMQLGNFLNVNFTAKVEAVRLIAYWL